MQIDKQQILALLQGRGEHDKAVQADADLPDRVDTEKHSDLLRKFGIKPADLINSARSVIAGKFGF